MLGGSTQGEECKDEESHAVFVYFEENQEGGTTIVSFCCISKLLLADPKTRIIPKLFT